MISDDLGEYEEQSVQVCEGQTTEARVCDHATEPSVTVELRIGDGSKNQADSAGGINAKRQVDYSVMLPTRIQGEAGSLFRVQLSPQPGQALAFGDSDWVKPDSLGRIKVPGVSDGAYHLRVLEWIELNDFTNGFDEDEGVLEERDLIVSADSPPVKFALGTGSISGRILIAADSTRKVDPVQDKARILDVIDDRARDVRIAAVDQAGRRRIRRARCDAIGNFRVRYLDPGTYTLVAYYPKEGWCRVDDIKVSSNETDVGERRLAPGATVVGSISYGRPSLVPDEVVATGPLQVVLRFGIYRVGAGPDAFTLHGLWPGRWTIAMHGSGGQVLASAAAEVSGTGTVRVKLDTGTMTESAPK